MGKRILSFLVALFMVVGMIPATAMGVFATGTEQAATYDALVATGINLDGSLSETAWLTSGKLSGGEAFDILWDGANLYFAVKAEAADAALTVTIGETKLITAAKAEGADAIEAKAPYKTIGISVIENVTLSVGESSWTGNVKLVEYERTTVLTNSALSTGGNYKATAYENGLSFDMPAAEGNTSTDYRAYALVQNVTTLAKRGNGIRFEFDFDPTELVAHSGAAQSSSGWTANAGMNCVMMGPNKERIVFGIDNIEGEGLMFIIQTATWDQRATKYLGRTAEDGVFHMTLDWDAEGVVHLYVDGTYLASFEGKQFVHPSETNSNVFLIEARRYRGFNETPVNFKVYNMTLSLPVEVLAVAEGTYDAFVASELTLDGNLDELAWRTGGKLGMGQPFDILFDGNNLYFGVVAAEGDETMTVKIGEKTVATAAKAGNGFEAQVEFLTKDIDVIEDVTITVGKSVWTGDVNLLKMARVYAPDFSANTNGVQYFNNNPKPDGNLAYEINGDSITMINKYIEGKHNAINGRVYSLQVGKGFDLAENRTDDRIVEFDFYAESLPAYSNNVNIGTMYSAYGMDAVISDSAKDGLHFGIKKNSDDGKLWMAFAWDKVDSPTNADKVVKYIALDKEVGDKFSVRLVWTADNDVTVYVDGVLKGTMEDCLHRNAIGASVCGFNLWGPGAACALTADGANDNIWTVSNVKLSKAVEVTYITDETLSDGEMTANFADTEPTASFFGWDMATWENFANGEGKVAALVYNQKVYVAVDAAGAVSATLGGETKTATADGLTVLAFENTEITEYGQKVALSVAVDGEAVWAAEGELTINQVVAGVATAIDNGKAVIKGGNVIREGQSATIVSTQASPMFDNKNCAYWIYNNADLANAYDTSLDMLQEQIIRIDQMPIGDQTGTFVSGDGGKYQAWGYTIMFETPSVVTSGSYDFFTALIYPDAENNLFLRALKSDKEGSEPVALGKKLGEEFKLGLLYGTDNSLTIYVDNAAMATMDNMRVTSGKVYGSAIMLKYMDPVTQTEGKADASITVKDVTLTKVDTLDLVNVEEEITKAAIFGNINLDNVTGNLPMNETFTTAYLGEKALRWTSSNESVIATDGTVTPNKAANKKVTLTVYLGDSAEALWSVEVLVPAASPAINALLSEEAVSVNGELRENAWLKWEKFEGIAGNIAAIWTKGYVYFAVYSAEADTLKLTLNGKEITVDLANATVEGAAGAQAAKGANGVVELAIPMSAFDFNLTDYNQAVPFAAKLIKGETTATLTAEVLNFSGDVAELLALANYTKDNGPWTLLTNSIGYNGTMPGKVNYVYKINNNIDHNELFILSNEFEFNALPISDGKFEKTSTQGNGFYYYFGDEHDTTRNGKTIAGAIYTEDGTNLKLRISGGQGVEGTVVELGKTVGEKFRLTQYWYPNDTLELYVDGVLVATIENASLTTSYLGIDVITYRYYSAEENASVKVKFTLSNQTTMTTKYENVLSELTKNAVFGRVDLEHVQKNLPLVTSYASANFEALTLKWTSSDESVVAADGTVTRDETEAKSAVITVYFVDADGNEIKLWDVTVTVDPMSVTKQPAPKVINATFAAPGSITVDGVVSDTETWLLNGWVLDPNGQAIQYYGAQWDQEYLYLLADLGQEEWVNFHFGDKQLAVRNTGLVQGDIECEAAANGSVVEIKIPVSEILDVAKITEYNTEIEVLVGVGAYMSSATLKLTNVDFWGSDNIYAGLPMLANNVKSVKMGTSDQPDGNQGAKQLENGWRLYDIYGGADAANPAGIRTYVLFMKMPVYENFADRSEATHIEFDFYAKSLPVWDWSEAIAKDSVNRAFATYGVTFSLSDKADSGKNSNVAVFGIVNTTEGLQMVVNRGADDYFAVPLKKEVGEEFRLGLTWQTNGDMVIYIDGVEFTTVAGLSRWVNSVGDTSFVVNMLRNKVKPASDADNMDVYLTNIGFGKAHSTENIIRNLTFADICGENENENDIHSDLILPTYMTNGQLELQYPIVWTSSDEATIDPETGKVTRPATGVKSVKLTATLTYPDGSTEFVEFNLLVLGESVSNGNTMVVTNDTNPYNKGAAAYTGLLFNLDKTNNSVVYAFPEGEVEKINLVTLTDLDTVSRLNRESLRLFVSDDNATYTEIEDYKLHNDGCNWYLYGFETESRYIKVHYTHRDQEDSNFINTPGEMIHVSWNESLVVPETAAEIDVPATTLRDQAVAIALPEGITAEGLRVALNGEILFHYVDKDGTVYVRIADPTSGKLQLWNAEDIELADKENVYEVTYGTRETLPSGGRWVLSVKAGQTYPDGSSVAVDTMYHMSGKNVYASTDKGYTWTKIGSVTHDESLSSGGWGIDSKTGRMFHEFYGPVTFVETDVSASTCVTYVFYSDDGGKTWTKASGLGKVEGDINSTYVLSYTDLTELAGNDGEGPNVDFVFPMGAQFNNNGAFCGRVAYTKDGGKTWSYSESKITYGNETAFEGGVSEATILEREDGTLVYYARCQSSGVDNFTLSYSLDHGVTWLTPGLTSSVYTVNTQALMMTYDFDGFDGNRTTGSPIFMWGGNNVLGGNSYIRNPLNFAVSTNEMDTFRNIQNIFSETFMEEYKNTHYITNASIQQLNDDDMYISFSRLKHGDSIYMIVNDFTDWFTRTKGAYDSFERGDVQYEGWITVKGGAEATNAKASVGNNSMLIKSNSQVTRSIPYLQNGVLSIDLFVASNSDYTFELQPAFAAVANKCAVINAQVKGNTLTINGDVQLSLKEGWNTVSFDLALTEDEVAVSVNGGEAKAVEANVAVGNYITYITFLPASEVYVDELLVESSLDAVTEATEADEAAAEAVIEQIKALSGDSTSEEVAAVKAAYNALTQVQKDLVNRNVPSGTSTNANDEGALINYYDVLMNLKYGTYVHSMSLTLNGNIGVNFYVVVEDALVDSGAYMEITLPNGTKQEIPVTEDLLADPDKDGVYQFYKFKCEVPAKEQADDIVVRIYDAEGNLLAEETYCAKDYADKVLQTTDEEHAELRNLVSALLNYGAYAQTHFKHNTSDLANKNVPAAYAAEYAEAFAAVDASTLADYAATGFDKGKNVTLTSASLILESETTMRLFFTVKNVDIEDVTFTCGDKVLTANKRGNLYYVDVTNIAAKDLNKSFTVSINDGAETYEVTYSPMNYCYNVLKSDAASETMKNVAKAIYLYNQAAIEYFA